MTLSYAQGTATTPLRGETIGEACAPASPSTATATPFSCHQGIRWTYARARRPRSSAARGRCSRSASSAATASASGRRTTPSGSSSSSRPRSRRDPRQRQPVLPAARARVRAAPVGLLAARPRAGLQGRRLPASCSTASTPPALRDRSCSATDWDALLGAGRRRPPTSCARARPSCSSTSRSTSSTRRARPGSRRARRSRTTTSSTTASSSARRCGYTPADRVCIPVPFYHCFGMVLGNLAIVTHGACIVDPGEAFDAARRRSRRSQAERCTSLYGVPTMFIAELDDPDFGTVRPLDACAPGSWPARRARSR